MVDEHFQAVVIGSGFGGAVSAFKLAEAGKSVCVLERGRAYPPGSFPRGPETLGDNIWDPSEGKYGLFSIWSFFRTETIVAAGLGGGSLIYANVLIRKDERWFIDEAVRGGGYTRWQVSRAKLDPHYDAVEKMLAPQQYPHDVPPYSRAPKMVEFRNAAATLGLKHEFPNLAITFEAPGGSGPVPGTQFLWPNLHNQPRETCRLCGECDIGCNFGSKNTLDYNYLTEAKNKGACIRTLADVRSISPRPGGGFEVVYRRHPEDPPPGPPNVAPPVEKVTCNVLVLAAGSLGSTFLLLKSRSAFPRISRMLGTRFSGNGDVLGFVTAARDQANRRKPLDASFGPVITSTIRYPDSWDGFGAAGRGFYLQEGGWPGFVDWAFVGVPRWDRLRRIAAFAWRQLVLDRISPKPHSDISAEFGRILGHQTARDWLPLLAMGRDEPDGRMRLNRGGFLAIDRPSNTSAAYFRRVDTEMRRLAEEMGGEFARNPLQLFKHVVTVHNLGGCPMGPDRKEGVVDKNGEVFGYPGLFVADGAVLPGPVGPNPSLTIAALADLFSARMIAQA